GFAYVAALAAAGLVLGNPLQLAVLFVLELVILVTAGRLRAALPYLMIALTTGIFLAILNPLFSPAGLDVLWEADLGFWHLSVTIQGIAYGLGTALRLAVVVLAFALYTVVLDTDDQLELLSRLSFRSGLIVSLATRLFPVLSRDGRRIADAQRSRGVELDAGGKRDRVVARLPLLAALSTQSLERAMDVAESMEARGYGRPGRTFWHRDRRWRFVDILAVVVGIIVAAALVAGLVGGLFRYRYYPLLDDPWPGLLDPVWLLALACLIVPVAWLSLPRGRHRHAKDAS
ncbi:MAG TPA: energy-coupling factor transporter transmembrane component T, partial [Thermoleophilia bacterium]|nr:energy-coupling factor transporter transmembrane component T [Thermoleophilia bacterium]